MRNKRLIAIIAAFALLLTQMNFIIGSAAEEEAASLYTESELASFNSKLEMLTCLGVIPESDKEADKTLSRSEFAGVIAKVLGNSLYEASFSENSYIDVKELTTNATSIISLKKMGLMVGVNGVEFKPDDKVTYAQAIKVLISALGYKDLAEVSGGYYNGYLKKAIDLDILRKGASDYDRELTWYDAVLMIDAALEVEIPEMHSVDDYITYTNKEDRNLLSVYHDIFKVKGIMTDNGQTALSAKSAAGLNNTVIGGMLMTNIPEKFTSLIGKSVVAYYRQGSDREFCYAYADDAKNEILVIDAYDLVTDNASFSKTNICYKNAKGKVENAKVSIYADFIYNGSAYPSFVDDTLKIFAGTLTLIDADGDNVYETIVADVFEDVLVKTLNTLTGAIYSNYSDPILYTEYDVVHFYDAAGEEIAIDDIKNDCLISVYKSKDYTKLVAYMSEQKSTMVIDSITTDEDDVMHITAGENTYRVGALYTAAVKDNSSSLKAPVTGGKYTVYLNIAGEAAMFQELQPREEYAYLLAVGTDTSDKLDGAKPAVKIVNEQGDCLTVKAAKNFTVIDSSGTYNNDSSAVINSADLYDTNHAFVPQLIRIKINAKGEFTKIEYDNTVPQEGELPNGFDESKFNKILADDSISIYSGYSSKNIQGKYIIDKTTKIFVIEEVGTLTTTDETKVKVIEYSDFQLTALTVAVYDTDQNWIAGAMLCSQSTTSFDDRTFTVVSSKTVIDEFGQERVQVEGYWKNNLWTFREHVPGVFEAALAEQGYTGIKTGDIFQIAFDNPKAEVASASLVASPSRDATQVRKGVGSYASTSYDVTTWGMVVGIPVSGTDGSVGIMSNGEYYVETMSSSAYVTVLDLRSGEITKGDKTRIPTIGSVDKDGNIDTGDGSVMIYGFRQRYHLCDILVVLK